MDVEPVAPERRLRIAVIADFEGPHARSWLRWFIARGHDVHAVSFYHPSAPVTGATMHALRPRSSTSAATARKTPAVAAGGRARGLARLAHAARYRIAGLRRTLDAIAPDVVHGHFVVEHGFYGAVARARPYVVTAWGSDVLVEPGRDPISKQIAKWTLRRADAVTSNNAHMAERIVALGADRAKVHVVTLGAERYDIERADSSVNRRAPGGRRAPVIASTRAHEPLYNIADIVDAFADLSLTHPAARLHIAHSGSLTGELRRRAAPLGDRVEFTGTLERPAFRDLLAEAEIFVSVPSSDATSVALLQAMAAGAFPIVSDLPSLREWIDDAANGFVVPVHRPDVLASKLRAALDDPALRRRAADANLRIVEERGLNEVSMMRMEQLYAQL